jgi:polyferredoxin
MAQTKRKRRTKHRGNAAGVVEARGRTGRAPEPSKSKGRRARLDRFSKPPTWRASFNRALIAVALFIVVVVLLLRQSPAPAVALGGFMLLLYVPMGYYTDLFFYRRRQAKLLAEREGTQRER